MTGKRQYSSKPMEEPYPPMQSSPHFPDAVPRQSHLHATHVVARPFSPHKRRLAITLDYQIAKRNRRGSLVPHSEQHGAVLAVDCPEMNSQCSRFLPNEVQWLRCAHGVVRRPGPAIVVQISTGCSATLPLMGRAINLPLQFDNNPLPPLLASCFQSDR